jgi:hypothetical protein
LSMKSSTVVCEPNSRGCLAEAIRLASSAQALITIG